MARSPINRPFTRCILRHVRPANTLFIGGRRGPGLCRLAPVLAIMALAILWPAGRSFRAQQAPNPPEIRSHESPPPFQIRVERNVVTVRVVVRDPEGRTVGNLTKDDFRLLDDGKAQEISGFTAETAADAGTGTEPSASPVPAGPVPAPAAVPQRFIGLFFDDLHLSREAVQRTRDVAWRFVATEVGPQDRVAIFTASHHDDLDFTTDRDQLHDALFRIAPRSRTLSQLSGCPSIDEYEAYLIDQRHDSQATGVAVGEAYDCDCVREDNKTAACATEAGDRAKYEATQIWNTADLEAQNALERIAAGINRLAAMAGQRTLVLVSPGFLTETRAPDIEALIQGALHHDVVISAIDAAGLTPFVSRPTESPSLLDQAEKDQIYRQGENLSRGVLANLAAGTGGMFFHNGNDFGAAFHETAAVPEVTYILSFSPEDFKLDGKFHALKVSLSTKQPWTLEARRGYFDPTETLAEQRPGQDRLDKLMFSLDEIHALPVDVSAEAGKEVQPPATLTVVIHVDLDALQFRKETDRSVNTLTFDTALFDHDGKYVSGKEESFDLHLKDGTLSKLAKSGIYLKTSFRPPPGSYRVREVVRDSVATQLSALNCEAEVPGGKSDKIALEPKEHPATPPKEERKASGVPMADWTPEEFIRAIPELKGLHAADSQDQLAPLLASVGTNVKAFFDTLPDVTAREEIVLERLDWSGRILEKELQQFNYLDIIKASATGNLLDEYRTDSKGRRAEPSPLEGGFVTQGFASMPDIFHPGYQPDSTYRYLGDQDLHARPFKVIYFEQIPGKARPEESIHSPLRTVDVLVQGVAWIDAESYQVAHMRTEVAFPQDDPYLKGVTTDSRFAEVHFKNDARAVWLPVEVTVTINWYGQYFSNLHRYSGFKLFQVSSAERVSSGRPD